ncbi:helix-turn-helix domain-containing protein [Flavobacteriaceae bacterium AU392]|nr:AraC family transcriptional regulator [Flavobacteriaceae bacterium]RKM85026.1 helix-turn-helix domain-containing protein [Flavobacteriaceae bacterium AU392]
MEDSKLKVDYINRLNKVFHFIEHNLDSNLSLNTISQFAAFSPFHFHRLFKMISGETLNEYITRQRIEKAASTLIHKREVTITELSLQNGFNNNSSFTRAFKKFYGVSPTNFRKQNPNKYSKICQIESKNGQAYPDHEKYICIINNLKTWIKMNAKIEIKDMPKLQLAYISSVGCQNLESAYQKLIQWATPKELLSDSQTKMVTIYYDSFKVTQEDKVRMSACITLNKQVEFDGGVGLTSVGGGKYIVGSFEIGFNEFEKSWTGLFIWMNENGYKKANENPFEIYHNNFREHPQNKCIVDFYIPIE